MNHLVLISTLFLSLPVPAQINTEIFLFDISIYADSVQIRNGRNISNNPGYDNQPSFYDDHTLLYAQDKGGNIGIASYTVMDDKTQILKQLDSSSLYSPTRVPNSNDFAAIRLDTNGKQRFFTYSGESETALPL